MASVGEKFRVNPEIKTTRNFRVSVNPYMRNFSNQIVTIHGFNSDYYTIYEDGCRFVWSQDLLIPLTSSEYVDYCKEDLQGILDTDIVSIFKTLNIKPLFSNNERNHLSGNKLSAIGAIFLLLGGEDEFEEAEKLITRYIDFIYLRGFMMGWSDMQVKKEVYNENDRFIVGYKDGYRARLTVAVQL